MSFTISNYEKYKTLLSINGDIGTQIDFFSDTDSPNDPYAPKAKIFRKTEFRIPSRFNNETQNSNSLPQEFINSQTYFPDSESKIMVTNRTTGNTKYLNIKNYSAPKMYIRSKNIREKNGTVIKIKNTRRRTVRTLVPPTSVPPTSVEVQSNELRPIEPVLMSNPKISKINKSEKTLNNKWKEIVENAKKIVPQLPSLSRKGGLRRRKTKKQHQ